MALRTTARRGGGLACLRPCAGDGEREDDEDGEEEDAGVLDLRCCELDLSEALRSAADARAATTYAGSGGDCRPGTFLRIPSKSIGFLGSIPFGR